MSVLVVSVSHRTAPMAVLSQLATDTAGSTKILDAVMSCEWIDEAVVISTCNRTEVYVATQRFHGAVEAIVSELAAFGGLDADELTGNCALYYDQAAVKHCFRMAGGLDSAVIGEHQILGQARSSLHAAQHHGTVGTLLNSLFQQALRVGKRVQTETEIGGAGRSMVTAAADALDLADLHRRTATIVGAGSMAALAAHNMAERGADLIVVNRTRGKAERLVQRTGGQVRELADLPEVLQSTDVLVTCTGARGLHLAPADLDGSPVRHVIDLALPADIDPAVGDLPGVHLVNLDSLVAGGPGIAQEHLDAATDLVEQEVTDFIAVRRAAAVTPTVVALRSMAREVLDAEYERLRGRLPELTESDAAEVHTAMRRVVEKLLHQPTVRVKKHAAADDTDYASALRELFALDPAAIDAVSAR